MAAQTKTRPNSRANGRSSGPSRGKAKTSAKSATKSKSRSKTSGAKTKSSAKRSAKGRARKSAPQASSNGVADSVKGTLASGAHDAVGRIKPAAEKAKVPLVATGAALVGVAGAVAVAASRNGKRRKVLGVSMPKTNGFKMPKGNGLKADADKVTDAVVNAAKHADDFGQRLSKVASSVQNVGETANQAAKKAK